MTSLKERIGQDVKDTMRARDKQRLGVLRMLQAEIKQVEVDQRIELDDARVLAVLDKMVKQRKDSLAQFEAAGREDLAAQERFELALLSTFMPEPLSETQLAALIDEGIAELAATSPQEMGKVMAWLKERVAGRADLGKLSGVVKKRLQQPGG